MDRKDEHIGFDLPKGVKEDFITKTGIPFKRSKEEVWESLSKKMEAPASQVKVRRLSPMLYVAASMAVLIATLALYMRFHSQEFSISTEIAVITLPDGSSVEARINSKFSYHPLWWRFNRQVKMEGEAYFDVEHGDKFTVVSPNGITRVLGTTFTVIDRSEEYRVSCFSGSVSVKAASKEVAAIIRANEEVILDEFGNYNVRMIPRSDNLEPVNKEAYFIFKAIPVYEVFRQLEDSYNIHIILPEDLDYKYSGNLSRELSISDLLNAVCIPLGLNYEQNSENTFTINTE